MTEMVTSGSMSGDERRSDGLLGESGHERRRSQQAPPVLYATAPVFDSTRGFTSLVCERLLDRSGLGGIDPDLGWRRRRLRWADGKPLGMCRVRRGEHGRSLGHPVLGQSLRPHDSPVNRNGGDHVRLECHPSTTLGGQ